MFTRIRTLLDRWHELTAVDELDERELDDLGLTRGQLRELVAIPADVPARVARMAELFGIPESALQESRADYLELLGTCQHCRDARTCTRKFETGAMAGPAQAGFCPNAEIYSARADCA